MMRRNALKWIILILVFTPVIAHAQGGSNIFLPLVMKGGGAPPTLTFAANPDVIVSGGVTTLTWMATNATTCVASGAWSGAKATAGSELTAPLISKATYSLTCSGAGGTVSKSVTVSVITSAQTGLDFPGNAGVTNTMRFRFLNPLAIYPATYIWRAFPRQQAGYYTTFFWGNDGAFWWANGSPDSYYGAHPYPDPPPGGTVHDWEISVEGGDFVNGRVVYDRWYTQALVVWADASGRKHHVFYWDLPATDPSRRVEHIALASYGNRNPPVPALTWGDAPWAPGEEVYNGILRGIQIYSTNLAIADILAEVDAPLTTAAGVASIWYMNLNPTPNDISDKSGRGNHPSWVGPERPGLWTGP